MSPCCSHLAVLVAGQSGKYDLKPVITVLPRTTTSMAVDGYLSNWTTSTVASLQLNGVVVRNTSPGQGGFFALSYLAQIGTAYDVAITTPNRALWIKSSRRIRVLAPPS
ncbi:MAG TPA: hypothetical protein VLC92_15805 [Rhodocyclaceae bacterium]|nr:hypothetical protein [Rhodocyclaceae bacterium]